MLKTRQFSIALYINVEVKKDVSMGKEENNKAGRDWISRVAAQGGARLLHVRAAAIPHVSLT